MCATKEHAETKIDRLIASMDRLSDALERGAPDAINVEIGPSVIGAPSSADLEKAIREGFTAAMERVGMDATAVSFWFELHLVPREPLGFRG